MCEPFKTATIVISSGIILKFVYNREILNDQSSFGSYKTIMVMIYLWLVSFYFHEINI